MERRLATCQFFNPTQVCLLIAFVFSVAHFASSYPPAHRLQPAVGIQSVSYSIYLTTPGTIRAAPHHVLHAAKPTPWYLSARPKRSALGTAVSRIND